MPLNNDIFKVSLMSEDFSQSLVLMLSGMGTVLVFLTILVIVTKITGSVVKSIDAKFGSLIKPDSTPVKTVAPQATAAAVSSRQDMSEVAAVLAIASRSYGIS